MRKRTIAAVLLFAVAGSGPVTTIADADSHRQAVHQLFELTDMRQKIDKSVATVLAMQLSQNPGLREHQQLVHDFLEKNIGWDSLKDDVTAMYLEAFTEQELKEMNAFYGSPTGRKVIKRLPELVQQRNRIAMQRMQENIGELQQMIESQSGPAAE
jgi:hypothetical protein